MSELYHYGRLGMKWGRHKYQDKFGVLTPEGKQHATNLESLHSKLSSASLTAKGMKKKKEVEDEYTKITGRDITAPRESTQQPMTKPKPVNLSKKEVKDMTNDELRAYNERKQLEQTYQNFQPKKVESLGKKFVSSAAKNVLQPMATEIGKSYAEKLAAKYGFDISLGKKKK